MKLKQYRVREFRSIWDSGPIDVDDQTTCFVGKNEAGKTTVLTALYRTNPIRSSDAMFDETFDYPKREVEDYRFAVQNGDREEAVIVTCTYELGEEDLREVQKVFGASTLHGKTFERLTYYGKSNSNFSLTCNQEAARKHLANSPGLTDELKTNLYEVDDWGGALLLC